MSEIELHPPQEVAPGIFRLIIPVPFRSLKFVNLWLLADGEGFAMVDCGWDDEATRARLEAGWNEVLGGRSVTRLIITHFHPDHMGASGFISDRWRVQPLTSQLEWMAGHVAAASLYSDDIERRARFYERHGLSDELLRLYREETIQYDEGARLPDSYARLAEGDALEIGGRTWRVLIGRGHSPEMVLLYNERDDILIAADQVLPKITPNVSVWPWEPEADPLDEFVSTLGTIAGHVTQNTLVLPSHREPFTGAAQRIAEQQVHHVERLDLLRRLLGEQESRCVGDLMAPLFQRKLDGHQVNFAVGETVAHLNRLHTLGEIDRLVDDSGRITYALREAGTPLASAS
ncbi:MAG: MBL fold metallo-hydrolase [Pseudomonadota bacterium]